jgi:hypothetical protein
VIWIVRGGFYGTQTFTDEAEARARFERDSLDSWNSGRVTLSVEHVVEVWEREVAS